MRLIRRTLAVAIIIACCFFAFTGDREIAMNRSLLWSRIWRAISGGPAPVWGCDIPIEDLMANEYSVQLMPYHSLARHKQTTGRATDLENAIDFVSDGAAPFPVPSYWLKTEDFSLLAAVRSHYNVLLVEYNSVVHLDPGPRGGAFDLPDPMLPDRPMPKNKN